VVGGGLLICDLVLYYTVLKAIQIIACDSIIIDIKGPELFGIMYTTQWATSPHYKDSFTFTMAILCTK
jgi:hypothetical protein